MPSLEELFTPIGPTNSTQAQAQPQQQQSFAQTLPQGPSPGSFQSLAQKMGLDTTNLHKSPTVAKLQLMNQMQSKLGPDFISHPDAAPLLSAFDAENPVDPNEARNKYTSMTSQATRTLSALWKLNGNAG